MLMEYLASVALKVKNKGKRSRRQTDGDALERLLTRLTVDQIRTTFARLGKTVPTKNVKDKDDLISALLSSGAAVSNIAAMARQIESSVPPKHIFACSYVGTLQVPKQRHFIAEHIGSIECAYSATYDLGTELTFEHTIKRSYWETDKGDPRSKRLKDESIVHPIFVKVILRSKLILVAYPGYDGRGAAKISYSSMVSAVLSLLTEHFNLQQRSLPVRAALDFLIANHSSRVIRLQAAPEYDTGKLALSVNKHAADIETFFGSLLAPFLTADGLVETRKALASAIRNGRLTSLLTVWPEEELVTRIEFWTHGSEFLYIWNKSERTYAKCLRIFELLAETGKVLDQKSDLLSKILGSDERTLFLAGDVAAEFSTSMDEVKRHLLEAVRLGFVVPVYRLRTSEILEEMQNDWTTKLATLSAVYKTLSGADVDGRNIENIEVGFQRSSKKAGTA